MARDGAQLVAAITLDSDYSGTEVGQVLLARARKEGVKLAFIRGLPGLNGIQFRDSILISTDGNRNDSAIEEAFEHELAHRKYQQGDARLRQLGQMVNLESDAAKALQKYYADKGLGRLEGNTLREELVATFVGGSANVEGVPLAGAFAGEDGSNAAKARGIVAEYLAGPANEAASRMLDAEYLQAVRDGDMEKAARMVQEAARRAGYSVGPVWHGSKARPTIFDKAFADREDNWSFSDSRSVADSYRAIEMDAEKAWEAYRESSGSERKQLDEELHGFEDEDGNITKESVESYVETGNRDQPLLWVEPFHRITGRPRSFFHSVESPGAIVAAYLRIKNPIHRYFNGTNTVQREVRPQGAPDGYIDHSVMDTETGSYRQLS